MKRIIAATVLALVVLSSAPRAAESKLSPKEFTDVARHATAILYSMDDSGTMHMHCTATSFEKSKHGYLFVSAAHCTGSDDVAHERSADAKNIPFYVTFDGSKVKTFYRATVESIGYQHRGDDFSVFEVETEDKWPTVPIGDEKKEEEGAAVLNIASPLGLGLQTFHGNISKLTLDRPIDSGDIHWTGVMLLQMAGVNGGSSGSAVISEAQQAVVGFLVGTIGGSSVTAIPASRFTAFRKAVKDGKYKYWVSQE